MSFRPITIRTSDPLRRGSPAKRAVRVIQGLQQKLSPLRRKIRDDVEVTAPMRPAPKGPPLSQEISGEMPAETDVPTEVVEDSFVNAGAR